MSLIEDAQARAATYSRMSKKIKKKAKELNKRCGEPVAIVCAAAGAAGGQTLVWESERGVLDMYRALPAEIRSDHTPLSYLEEELRKARAELAKVRQQSRTQLEEKLRKERARLAKVRQQSLKQLEDMAASLGDMTLAEARELLATAEAKSRAIRKRLEEIAPDTVVPQLDLDVDGLQTNGADANTGTSQAAASPPQSSTQGTSNFG